MSVWSKDAETWGPAINDASWEYIAACRQHGVRLDSDHFNKLKTLLRRAIIAYDKVVNKPEKKGKKI